MSPDKLVYMANQIGKFFAHQGEAKAVAGIADHLAKFWDPRMRSTILAHLEAGGAGLDPFVLSAVRKLHEVARAPGAGPARQPDREAPVPARVR